MAVLSYFYADKAVTLFFAQYKDTLSYDLFRAVTRLGKAEYALVPSGLFWLFFRKKYPDAARVAAAVFIASAAAGLFVDVIKYFAGRMRPVLFLSDGLYGFTFFKYKYEYVSFPSGHSADIFGAVTVLAKRYRKLCVPFYLLGVLVALSRIATLHHYMSDVIVGSMCGYAIAVITYKKLVNGRK